MIESIVKFVTHYYDQLRAMIGPLLTNTIVVAVPLLFIALIYFLIDDITRY